MAQVVDITGNDELCAAALRLAAEHWRGPLTVEQFVSGMQETDEILTRAGMALHSFAVVLDGEVVASCRVLSRPLYVGAGRLAEDHCVASVVVSPAHRRRGHAEQLVSHAVKVFSNDEDQVSLWSDVGAYYERCGFRFVPRLAAREPDSETESETEAADADADADADTDGPQHATLLCRADPGGSTDCEWLGLSDMGAIATEHCRLVNRAVDAQRLATRGAVAYGAVEPSEALYRRAQATAVLGQQLLGGTVPEWFGARTANGHGWAAWTYFVGTQTLLVLGISGSADEVAALLVAAGQAAAEFPGMQVMMFESQLLDRELKLDEVAAALRSRGVEPELVQRSKMLPMSVGRMEYAFPGGYAWF